MKRYFFNVRDGQNFDEEGVELPDLDTAKVEAVRLGGALLREADDAESFAKGQPWQLQVTDGPSGSGRVFFTLNFAAVNG